MPNQPQVKKPMDIETMMKKGLLKKGSDESLQVIRISSGIELLDELLGGGVPRGKVIQLYGPESTGKTLICQYLTKAVQNTELPMILYVDLENSFDANWWSATGIDMDKLIVTSPASGEEAVDVMLAFLRDKSYKVGLIIVDSLAGLIPSSEVDPDRSTENNPQPGLQARLITRMYGKTKGEQGDTIIVVTNQMRDSIGTQYDELGVLPGGRANRHYCHIILRTRREGWINDSDNNHTGFTMEIISRKNKTCSVADGTSIMLPFDAQNQIDMLIAYTNDALEKKIITRNGPYYAWMENRWLGKANMQQWFKDNPEAVDILKQNLYSVEVNA